MIRPPRILLLSGACLVGQNVLACLGDRRNEVRLLATNSVVHEPALFEFDTVYLTPPIREQRNEFSARFAEILSHCEPDLVIPCRDDDVSFLAEVLDREPAWRGRFLCGDSALASTMLDKLESWEFCHRNELPFVPTADTQNGIDASLHFAREHGYPLVAKPRRGFASFGVRLILNDAQLQWACAQPDYVIQKYLGEAEAVHAFASDLVSSGFPLFHSFEQAKTSIQASIAPGGSVSGVFVTSNVMHGGRSERVYPIDDAQVVEPGQRWAETFAGAGWRGPLNIQCQRGPDGRLAIHELNGRFTGATAARRHLGFDEVGVALRDWIGLALPPTNAICRSVVRYPASYAADTRDVDRLLNDGFWRTPDRLNS